MEKIKVIEMIKRIIRFQENTRFIDGHHHCCDCYVKDEDTGNFYLISGISILDHKIYFDEDKDYIYYDKDMEIYRLKEDN